MGAHDVMHLAAIGFTVVGVCAHRGWRSRASSLGLGAAILMLVAMVDSAYSHRFSVVVWIPLLLAAAIALAAARSARRERATVSANGGMWLTAHDPLGLVVTAAILPLMQGRPTSAGSHAHGPAVGVLIAAVLLVALGYVLGSLIACARYSTATDRVQFGGMGLAALFMALSVAA